MGETGQYGLPGRLILGALEDDHPAAALARLHRSPRVVRLLGQLFVVALRRSFVPHDPREITGYVHGLLTWLDLPARGLLARQTEAVIRAALGEPALAAGVGPVRRHEIICSVVGDLTRPPGPGRADLESLVVQAGLRIDRYDGDEVRTPRRRRR
jgi:hypothetical protein